MSAGTDCELEDCPDITHGLSISSLKVHRYCSSITCLKTEIIVIVNWCRIWLVSYGITIYEHE